jgi:hypothetical protein
VREAAPGPRRRRAGRRRETLVNTVNLVPTIATPCQRTVGNQACAKADSGRLKLTTGSNGRARGQRYNRRVPRRAQRTGRGTFGGGEVMKSREGAAEPNGRRAADNGSGPSSLDLRELLHALQAVSGGDFIRGRSPSHSAPRRRRFFAPRRRAARARTRAAVPHRGSPCARPLRDPAGVAPGAAERLWLTPLTSYPRSRHRVNGLWETRLVPKQIPGG